MNFISTDFLTLTNIEMMINEPNPHKKAAEDSSKIDKLLKYSEVIMLSINGLIGGSLQSTTSPTTAVE